VTERERAEAVVRKKQRQWVWNLVALIALVLGLGAAVSVSWDWQQRAASVEETAVTFAQQVQEACADGGLLVDGRDLCPQADAIVEDPAAPTVAAPPEDGEDGADALPVTNAQVDAAVDRWCETEGPCATPPTMAQVARAVADLCDGGCDGKDGKDGEDGNDAPPPDPAELQTLVMQTVLTYCDAGPQCDQGDTGPAGKDGPTLEEVRAIVTTVLEEHCAAQPGGTCEGDTGGRGPQGTAKPGTYTCPDGESVVGFTVADDGAVELSCQAHTPPVVDPPTPSPTPTP